MAGTTIVKRNWYGGINQLPDPAKVNIETEYTLLINGRVRENSVQPVNGPLNITAGLPNGTNRQGIYGIGRFLLVFLDGLAYYKDYSAATPVWHQVVDFEMSATAPKIWVKAIPASTLNFVRKATDDTDIKSPVALSGTRNSSPQALIAMDGVSQPWLIFPDGSARLTQTFTQWTIDNAEYVPIGKFPFYYNGILYCIVRDASGAYNQICRSVTGRPCDFVIIVGENGLPNGNEQERGATALADRVDFSDVTSIGPINATDGAFLVTTAENSYTVTPDYTPENLIAGEPTFRHQFLFSVGAVNDESVTDVLGDTTIVHSRGIRSFNGVQQFKFEGKYAAFNLKINRLLEGIVQTVSAVITWENYAVYSVQTIHGYGLLWYDMLLDRFVSLDLYDNFDPVVQFATLTYQSVNKLFALTNTGQVYELFAGDLQPCVVLLPDLLPESDDLLHELQQVSAVLTGSVTDGYAEVFYMMDGTYIGSVTRAVPAEDLAPDAGVVPISGKLTLNSKSSTIPILFGLKSLRALGARITTGLRWNTGARLVETTLTTDTQNNRAPAAMLTPAESTIKIIFIGSDAQLSTDSSELNAAIKEENPDLVIGLGSHTFLGTAADVATRLIPHWNNIHEIGRFYATPGPAELDASVGEPFFQYVRQYPTRYSVVHTAFADIFLFNSGFNSAGAQVEPDNLDGPSLATSSQAQWLARETAASTRRFKFLALGTPPRSSIDGYAQAALDALPFSANGIEAVLSGRGNYERLEDSKRVTFFNVGTGGNNLGEFGTPRADSAVRISTLGYVRLTLAPLSALFEFVTAAGEVLDRRLL